MNKKNTAIIRIVFVFFMFLTAITAVAQDANEQYRKAITSADEYFAKADYLNAKASYQVATQLKPDEEYPKNRLMESINLLRIQMEEMAVFNDKVAFADRLFDEGSLNEAIMAYQDALKMMPSQEYPSLMIEQIRKRQAEEAQNEARYNKLLADGDALFRDDDLKEARKKYEEASNVIPDRKEANDKIKAVDVRLSELAAQQSGYQKALSEAEMYHARKDYENELLSYNKASELKPDEAFPQIRIRELNDFLRKYESYNMFVAQADELYIGQQYAEAKSLYEKALEVLPDESYPREIISRINIALSEKTERNKAAYEEAIAQADQLFNAEDYDAAMLAYSEALRFWPEGEHARKRLGSIAEIRALQKAQEEAYTNTISLADKLFAGKDYATAKDEYRKAADIKPFEQYPKVRLNEIEMILAELQTKLEQYDRIILGADKLFNAGDYQEARIQYLKASEILSDRTYPEDQIRMIDEILGLQNSIREDYLAAIARGDEHFSNREWEDAKVDYATANDLIPEEQYPDDKITEINEILARLKAAQETYTLALKNADQLFSEKDYAGALLEYRRAADIFSDEEYPRMKIGEINNIMASMEEQKMLEERYAAAIAAADGYAASEDFGEARAEYENAAALKPGEQYPKDKIIEIDAIMQEQALMRSIEENYTTAFEAGNAFFTEEKYAEAKLEYRKAMDIKPAESAPVERIAEIDAILAEQQRQAGIDAAYTASIAAADEQFAAGNYTEARINYLDAATIKETETYPQEKIAEIDAILSAEAAEAERLAQLAAQYVQAVADADALLAREDFTAAREKYMEALSLKPAENYPQQKISEIDIIVAGFEAARILEEQYTSSISAADALMEKEKYEEARSEYLKASTLKPAEQYPTGKVSEIDGILLELAKLRSLEENYSRAMEAGLRYFNEDRYEEAKTEYQHALETKPNETAPAERITEIDAILAAQQRQAEIDAAYAASIAAADAQFAAGNYAEARINYLEAATVKKNETYPQEKITEIDAILSAEAAEAERLAQLAAQYAQSVADADALMALEDYAAAREKYMQALSLKPAENYPQQKISEIDIIVAGLEAARILEEQYATSIAAADALMNNEKYEEARSEYLKASALKPAEQYPTDKVSEIDGILVELARLRSIEEEYTRAMDAGLRYFNEGRYEEAKTEYQHALETKPDETAPAERITEIDAIIAEMERQQNIIAAYTAALENADKLFAEANYSAAIPAYQKAADIKPEETYPAEKIKEAEAAFREQDRLAQVAEEYRIAIETAETFFNQQQYAQSREAFLRAQEIKAEETYPAEKIAEIDNLLANIEQQRMIDEGYANALARGDNFFNSRAYAEAKAEFEKALGFKAGEQYPAGRIAEIESIMADEARRMELEKAFTEAISRADAHLDGKQYAEARETYAEALTLKPADAYANEKILQIDNIVAEAERLKKIEESYTLEITRADDAFVAGQYDEARNAYTAAAAIKPGEDYPQRKITEIEAIERGYANAIREADGYRERSAYMEALQAYEKASGIKPLETYPREKIGEINTMLSEMAEERQKAYDAAVVQGDNYFNLGNYRSARSSYETAVNIKSDEPYARKRLDEATTLYLAEIEVLKVDYRKYIADADNFFRNKIYDGAIENYRLAAAILPDEQYPTKMISRITQIINDNAITDVNKLAQIIPNNTERKFPFSSLPVTVRKENYILIKARNLSDTDFKMLVNFGQDDSKSGGVVLQVPKGEEVRDYIIRIGALYKWFSEDNNWLSIYPEGGDIEVALVRVSKSD